jgi:hypothetical protein
MGLTTRESSKMDRWKVSGGWRSWKAIGNCVRTMGISIWGNMKGRGSVNTRMGINMKVRSRTVRGMEEGFIVIKVAICMRDCSKGTKKPTQIARLLSHRVQSTRAVFWMENITVRGN